MLEQNEKNVDDINSANEKVVEDTANEKSEKVDKTTDIVKEIEDSVAESSEKGESTEQESKVVDYSKFSLEELVASLKTQLHLRKSLFLYFKLVIFLLSFTCLKTCKHKLTLKWKK